MQITRTRLETRRAPAEWFTGEVWLGQIAVAPSPSRLRAYSVHFTRGARRHQHPFGQVIHVTEGLGLVKRRDGPVELIRAGDTVRFEPDEDHWHGAAPTWFMTHLALHEAGDDARWGAHVTDDEYLQPTGAE